MILSINNRNNLYISVENNLKHWCFTNEVCLLKSVDSWHSGHSIKQCCKVSIQSWEHARKTHQQHMPGRHMWRIDICLIQLLESAMTKSTTRSKVHYKPRMQFTASLQWIQSCVHLPNAQDLKTNQIKSNQIKYYIIVRPKVNQRAGHLCLPHIGITKTEKNITKT